MGTEYIDENGYLRKELEHSTLIHRQVAYKEIYLRKKHLYPLKFSDYQVHHIDGNKQNNGHYNLLLLTREDHEKIHGINMPDRIALSEGNTCRERKTKELMPERYRYLKLLIGHRKAAILTKAMKYTFLISMFLLAASLIAIPFSYSVSLFLGGLAFMTGGQAVLAALIISILSIIGWIYLHIANSVNKVRKAFGKKA